MTEIRYVPLPDTTPEKELEALAVVYKFVLDRHAKNNASETSGDTPAMKVCPKERRPA